MNNREKMKLWYNKPASEWVEALPLGNGKLGAMVYGNPFDEIIQVNEETIWSKGENDSLNPKAKEIISKAQQHIIDGNLKEADDLAKEAYMGNDQGSYQTLGNIHLNLSYGENNDIVHTYRRELDLETAISRVRYSIGGISYRLESFISAVDNVYALSMTSSDGLTIQLDAFLSRPVDCVISEGPLPLSLMMKGFCADKQIEFYALLKIIPAFVGYGRTGLALSEGEKIKIENASDFTLLFTAATSFNNQDPQKVCIDRILSAEKKGFKSLKADHIQDYSNLYKRMDIFLGEDKLYDFIPTDERLMRVSDGAIDNSLVALYYQYGRYLLISSSRQDSSLPANLQGIWNNNVFAPWGSRYTININTEMNYWIAEQCNLSECHEPLFRLIDLIKSKGRIMAKQMYGCRGFVAHHNTNIWGDASPQDSWPTSTYWSMGAAWLCLHLWDNYDYTQDMSFLAKAYPTMKEACEFFLDFLIEDKDGRLVTCPSLSPENIYRTANGYETAICAGPTMDNSILRALFQKTIDAANLLGLDSEFTQELAATRKQLPELKIGENGTIMEWPDDYEEIEIGHRHISHLFALYPADEITVDETPKLAEAARRTLDRRLSFGGGHTGWSCAWIINMWARLWDAENAHKYVQMILAKSTYPNLFDAHPPFQIDGNFGATAGISEMLLQSYKGVLNLLPALPNQWKDGYISGLKARGNYTIDIKWEQGQLVEAVIRIGKTISVNKDGKASIKIKYKDIKDLTVKCKDQSISYSIEGDIIVFEADADQEYLIINK